MKYIWSVIFIVIGILIMRYNFQIVQVFGKIGWAETHMSGGLGGTYSLWKLIGLAVVILSLLYMFSAMGFILSPLGSVFGGAAVE